jgi:hypothetical protein
VQKDPWALKATKDGYRNSLDMGWDAAIDYAGAKEMELVLRQGDASGKKASAISSRANSRRAWKATAPRVSADRRHTAVAQDGMAGTMLRIRPECCVSSPPRALLRVKTGGPNRIHGTPNPSPPRKRGGRGTQAQHFRRSSE